MQYIAIIIGIIMIFGSVWAIVTEKLFRAIIVFGVVSLSSSILFLLMEAPDVAITEAAIGSGITTALFIFTYKKLEVKRNEK